MRKGNFSLDEGLIEAYFKIPVVERKERRSVKIRHDKQTKQSIYFPLVGNTKTGPRGRVK
jgi:hypothetical protein